ncbi:MAG: PEP/pyruvate-binding domain-containing protein [Proteobacteria bacterium]|nr:PEP/pyruvate-binding domain-containing protein [Pseudomonadota bacterium]
MLEKEKRFTLGYDELEGNDFNLVGKKNANLGEMLKAGIPISPGFAVTVHANDQYLIMTGIKEKISSLINPPNAQVPLEKAQEASKIAMELIESAEMPAVIGDVILSDYHKMCEKYGNNLPVAVRSSGAASMPGQMETYLNICGDKDLIDYVKKCWSSAYNTEAIMYRMNKGMEFLFNIGAGIPKMVNSRVSGIIFTINPINGDMSKISIDASYGLGEAVVSGLVTPDTYLIDKITLDIIKIIKGSKEIQCVYRENASDIVQTEVPEEKRRVNCLSMEEVKELARVGKLIEKYYGKAYDIEFGVDADIPFPHNIIILQVRPESVWSKKEVAPKTEVAKDPMERLLGVMLTGVKLK